MTKRELWAWRLQTFWPYLVAGILLLALIAVANSTPAPEQCMGPVQEQAGNMEPWMLLWLWNMSR